MRAGGRRLRRRALHRSYLAQADTFPPAVRGADAAAGRRPAHRGRGGRAQPAPAGHPRGARARCAGRRSSSPGELPGLRLGAAVLRPRRGARARADRRAARRRRTPRSGTPLGITTVVYHVVAQPGSGLTAAPRRARRVRAGQRALRGRPRLRDDPQPGARAASALVDELVGAAYGRAASGPRRCWRGRSPRTTRPSRRWPRDPTPDPDDGPRGAARARCGGRREWSPPSRGTPDDRRHALHRAQRRAAAQGVPHPRGVARGVRAGAPAGAGQVQRPPAADHPRRRGAGRAGPAHRRLPARAS